MKNKRIKSVTPDDLPAIEAELKRVKDRSMFRTILRSTVYTLIVVAACAVLIAVLFMPVLRIYGNSMTPTLKEGEIVVSIKTDNIRQGEIVGAYFGSKLLIKRCVASAYQWVDIKEDGTVYVDGEPLDEPYLTEKALGECSVEFPFQVPENSIFVLGDHRATSIDSRSTAVGCIDLENVVGRIMFRVWPLESFGPVG